MTKKELVKFLVDNFTDEDNRLDLSGLDFSEYEVNVNISEMKVNGVLYQRMHEIKGDIYQNYHVVKGNLNQKSHKVNGELLQGEHEVDGYISQSYHKVNGNLFQRNHKVSGSLLEGFSTYGEDYSYKKPAKQLKKITLEQLKEMGYELEEKK